MGTKLPCMNTLVERGKKNAAEEADAADDKPKPERKVVVLPKDRAEHVVDNAANARNGEVDAKRKSKLFVLEPDRHKCRLRNSQALTAKAEAHAPSEHQLCRWKKKQKKKKKRV